MYNWAQSWQRFVTSNLIWLAATPCAAHLRLSSTRRHLALKNLSNFSDAESKGSCGHIKPAEVNQEKLSDAKAEEQFLRWFDIETGERRLTCRSRLPIPENPEDSDRAQEFEGELVNFSCALMNRSSEVTSVRGSEATCYHMLAFLHELCALLVDLHEIIQDG